MVWWLMVREIADESGKGIGKYRLTAKSDDPPCDPFGLCSHEHNTEEEAQNCPDARREADRYP